MQQILFCNKSDTQEVLALDKEIQFLTEDMDHLERNKDAGAGVVQECC